MDDNVTQLFVLIILEFFHKGSYICHKMNQSSGVEVKQVSCYAMSRGG